MSKNSRRFIVTWTTRDVDQFRAFAKLSKRLSDFGEVFVDVSTLADKAFHIIPEGGSSWHEYSANWPTLHRFFPHPKVAEHLPADWVGANRDLITAKAAVLGEMGLGAAFHGNDPHFWPESFWRDHPHLRGPRIDHPRRSRKEEFAVCCDLDEGRDMVAWEMAEMKRHVPMLGVFTFNTNDAGSGFCWAAAQYAGPNGPRHCRGISAGLRVRRFHEALHEAARSAGGDVSIYMDHANFWQNEIHEVVARLPDNSGQIGRDPTTVTLALGEYMGSAVRGLLNPLRLIESTEQLLDESVRTVFLRFSSVTHRGATTLEAVERGLDLLIDCLQRPLRGTRARLNRLGEHCATWAGQGRAEELLEAFVRVDKALAVQELVAPGFKPVHGAVSMRHATRPLVIKPEALRRDEEDYFLPYVFNTREGEARSDYIDLHGGRMSGPEDRRSIERLERSLNDLRAVAEALEGLADAPAGEWLFRVATSVRIEASMFRSMMNFFLAQRIRDRCAAQLAREQPYVPDKIHNWDGEGEVLAWNERMRDEFDNATELLALLEQRGADQIFHAEDDRHQSCFLLGPNLVDDLRKKVRIMRDHWLDVEAYLAPPHK